MNPITVTLYGDVGFDRNYKNVIDFTSEQERSNYFANLQSVMIDNVVYNKIDNQLKIEKPLENCLNYVYAVFPINDRMFYFWVDGCELINDEITALNLTIDPYQSFLFDFTLGESFVVREHCDRWKVSTNEIDFKKPTGKSLNTSYKLNLQNIVASEKVGNSYVYWCVVSILETDDDVTTTNYYAFPISNDRKDIIEKYTADKKFPTFESVIDGSLITDCFDEDPDNIVSVSIVPYLGYNLDAEISGSNISATLIDPDGTHIAETKEYTFDTESGTTKDIYLTMYQGDILKVNSYSSSLIYTDEEENPSWVGYHSGTTISLTIPTTVSGVQEINFSQSQFHNIFHVTVASIGKIPAVSLKNTDYIAYKLGEDELELAGNISTSQIKQATFSTPVKPTEFVSGSPKSYDSNCEPELFKAPFMKRVIQDQCGNEVAEIDDKWFVEKVIQAGVFKFFCYMSLDGTSANSVIRIPYPSENNSYEEFMKSANLGLVIQLPPQQVDVPSNAWQSYQIQSRDTDRQMIWNNIAQSFLGNSINSITYNGGISGMIQAGSIGQRDIEGNIYGHATRKYGKNLTMTKSIYPIKSEVVANQFMKGMGMGGGLGLAGSVGTAVVDTALEFQAQEIKENAIKKQPAVLLLNGSGDNIARMGFGGISLVELKCDDITFDTFAKTYHKYGYEVNRFEVPNVRTRKFYNFIQTNEVKINGNLNSEIKTELQSIFSSGVTIWHGDKISQLSGINDYSKENIERSLCS